MRLGVMQPDGSWRITDVAWPASRWKAATEWRIKGGYWVPLIQDPKDLFKINYMGT